MQSRDERIAVPPSAARFLRNSSGTSDAAPRLRLAPVLRHDGSATTVDHPVKSTTRATLPILRFRGMKDWERWLAGEHESAPGVWLMIAKKGSALRSVSYAEALEAALCYGWIDGQKQAYDSEAWLQKFTPRGPRSIWSQINRQKAEQLMASGRMTPAGLRAIENAKRNGQWENAYHSAKSSTIPEDFLVAMAKNRKAKIFFETLNSANRYAILFRIQTAKKAETRARRIEQFIKMLERHEKIHP
jgi:uncharacterized protein YdeI (YjbR/CyaY-like superfamily)